MILYKKGVMAMQKKNQTITIQVTAEDKKMAQTLARQECRSVSGFLRQLLRQEIRRQNGNICGGRR